LSRRHGSSPTPPPSPAIIYELDPNRARKGLDDIQTDPASKPNVHEEWATVPAEVGDMAQHRQHQHQRHRRDRSLTG